MQAFVSSPFILFHWSMSIFALIPYCFHDCSFQTASENRSVRFPAIFFLLMIALAIWGHLCTHKNFRILFPIFVENTIGISIGIALNPQMTQYSMDILIIHEHRTSFHLFVISLVSVQFSVQRSFTSSVKFIPKNVNCY